MIEYTKFESYESVMRKYTSSKLAMYVSFDELAKYYSIVHQYDYECAEDVIGQLCYELNNIIFATTPVKMSDILRFTQTFVQLNKNICFCFLADFYQRNVLDNKERYV